MSTISQWTFRLWNRLVEPPAAIQDVKERYDARLMSSLLLIMLPLTVLVMAVDALLDLRMLVWEDGPLNTLSVTTIGLIGLHLLARRGFITLSKWLVMLLGTLVILLNAAQSVPPHPEILFMLALPLFGTLFFSTQLVISIGVVGLLLVLGFAGLTNIMSAIGSDLVGIYVVLLSLIVFLAWQRSVLESMRIEALSRGELRLRHLIAQIPSTVWTTDSDLKLTSFIAGRQTGTWEPVTTAALRDAHERALAGAAVTVEHEVLGRPHQAYIEPLRDENGVIIGCIGVSVDTSERRRLEMQRMSLAGQREQSRVITDFMRAAAHDLRTPLTILKTNLYLLDKNYDVLKAAQRLRTMNDAVDQIESRLERMFQLVRLDTEPISTLSRIDIYPILNRVFEELAALAQRKHLVYRLDVPSKLPKAAVYVDELAIAIHHVIRNAIEFTQEGGTVWVRAESATDEHIMIEVEDTGRGIAPEDVPHVFDRFFRSDRHRPMEDSHVGLGLSIAKQVIERHGGQIMLETELGHGTCFRLLLPTALRLHDDKVAALGKVEKNVS